MSFDPSLHLSTIKGQDYLEVKWRIAWFRDLWPAGSIETQIVKLLDDRVIVRAIIECRTEDGERRGAATGHGTCTAQEFGQYIEKAETKAIGRALAALGFGTQFSADELDAGAQVPAPPRVSNYKPPNGQRANNTSIPRH